MESAPHAEITRRVAGLQERLEEAGIDLALIGQAADLFYYAGVLADGFLAVAPAAGPRFLVRRPRRRLAAMKHPWPLAFYRDVKEIPGLLAKAGLVGSGPLGLELDVMPAALYRLFQGKLFPGRPIKDLSTLIRRQRMVKSAYEIGQLRRAAAMLDQAFEVIPGLVRPGVTELEVAAALENRLRLLGHQGLIRTRRWNLEQHFGHVLSGQAGLQVSYIDAPTGGWGLGPAFPQGASMRKLSPGEPISVDLAGCINGYVADMTRMYALESLPERAWEAYVAVAELYSIFEDHARPGVMPGDLHRRLMQKVRERGLEDYFMGPGEERVSFIAHGVGLELDEYPFITARFPYPLEENVVLAFEPKFFLPDIGMIGQEDTGVITEAGVEWLTQSPREIKIV
ncbi:MAG: aminopeptidase P family protein [Deltaproteobacteria bacterium]|nr:aminopeptidase P family protein [Deltaproteobacteria bacterium]